MLRTFTRVAFVVGVAAAAGCGVGGPPVLIPLSNIGALCVYPAGEEDGVPGLPDPASHDYPAGQLVNLAVQFPVCLSMSCDTNRMATCAVANSKDGLQVTSHASYLSHDGTCTNDCGLLIARCQTPALPAGTTTLQHGTTTLTLTLPFSGPPPCARSPGS